MRRRPVLLGGAMALLARPAAGFALQDKTGRVVTQADFAGRVLVVFFGYTRCPDLCPATLSRLAAALPQADPAGTRMACLFISVDPADSPGAVARYAALFSPRIIGLGGSADAVGAAEREFHVYVQPGQDGRIAHSALLYVLGPGGGLVDVIPATLPAAALGARLGQVLRSSAGARSADALAAPVISGP